MAALTHANRFRPSLDVLEGRDVPSASVDLTALGSAGAVDGALFQQTNTQPTGTGHISSFLRLQGSGVERGYNTDARPLQFNENSSRNFTRSLRLNDVPVVIVGGVAYREFLLDINQRASSPLLSLDELQIFVGDRGNLAGYDSATRSLAGLASVYDLDGTGDNSILMNYSLNHGSGSGDVAVLIPDRVFGATAANPNPFIYLYSGFGQTAGAGANAGFEEWAVKPGSDVSAYGSIGGRVYFDANRNGIFDEGEAGIAGVYITVSGIDDSGNQVFRTMVTNADGSYNFVGLRPGTYTITESQPDGYEDGDDAVGSLGGELGADLFSNIQLRANDIGWGYDFGEVLTMG